MSTWAGRDITPTLLSHAWRIRSVLCRTKSAIFQGRPQCPLMVGLCLQSRLHHALPDLLSQVLANLYHVQEVAVPMKHRSWSDVITKEMVALGNCRKPMPPKPYEGRSDLRMLHRTVYLHSQQQNHHYRSGRQPTSPWQLQLRW